MLLGRGASDKVANGEVAKMARWIFETTEHEQVDYAFTGVTHPRLESVVQRQITLGAMQVVIAPLYLFTGRLMKRIQRQAKRLSAQYPQQSFALAGYLGVHEHLCAVMDRRLEELRTRKSSMMECDGCKFREIAEHEGHGHHHH